MLALQELDDRFRDLEDLAAMSFVAAEIIGCALSISRAGYCTFSGDCETLEIERDWTGPGIASVAGGHTIRSYRCAIEDLRQGETVVVEDTESDPRTSAYVASLQSFAVRAFINVPVMEQGRLVSMFFAHDAQPRCWTADEIGFMRTVAARTRSAVERRRAEIGLRELTGSLERLVAERTAERDRMWRNSRDLLVVLGADGVFRTINPAWTDILGHDPSDVVGRTFTEFVWPEDAGVWKGGLEDVAAKAELTDFEIRFRHRDGSYRWISWHRSIEGELIYAYGRDVTAQRAAQAELRRTEEALRQSQKMEAVGQLTGGLAHDFNNLLTSISGNLELLTMRIAQGRIETTGRYIGAAQSAAKRAAVLTHRLLAFSRRQTLEPVSTDIDQLVAGMAVIIRSTVGSTIKIEFIRSPDLWPALVDANQLENALLNLCLNARDAMPEGGRIVIETANRWLDERAAKERDLPVGEYVSLYVTDTGTGMPPEVKARAFDPFFTTKPVGQGTGLGLSMIYGFARQSGGQVRICSEVGQGTSVCLYVPREPVRLLPPVVAERDDVVSLAIPFAYDRSTPVQPTPITEAGFSG